MVKKEIEIRGPDNEASIRFELYFKYPRKNETRDLYFSPGAGRGRIKVTYNSTFETT